MGLFSGNEEENRKAKLEIARLKRIADSVEGDPYSSLAPPEKREMYEKILKIYDMMTSLVEENRLLRNRIDRLEKHASEDYASYGRTLIT